jgi:hypothetical protein
MLLRTPNQAGLDYWLTQFASKAETNEDLLAGFVGSAEYLQRVID